MHSVDSDDQIIDNQSHSETIVKDSIKRENNCESFCDRTPFNNLSTYRSHHEDDQGLPCCNDTCYFIRTKEGDGPSAVVFATVSLINALVKKGTMSVKEARQVLEQSCSCGSLKSICSDPPRRRSDASESDCDITAATIICSMQADIAALSIEVAGRLKALCDRIRSRGKASLPTSRAVMGPSFVPALDFLRSLILDAKLVADEDTASSLRIFESK